MPAPKLVKVGLDAKRPALTRKSVDFARGVITVTISQFWVVEWDSQVTDPALQYGASVNGYTVPDTGSLYGGTSQYQGIRCNQVMPTLDPAGAGKLWRVQVDYSSLPQPQTTGKWNVTINIDGVPVTEPMDNDANGQAVCNSAGQKFSNQPTTTHYDNVYRVAFQSNAIDVPTIDALQGKLNAEEFTLTIPSLNFNKTFEAQSTVLARCPTTCTLTGNPQAPVFWNVEYELHYRRPMVSPTKSPSAGAVVSGWFLFLEDMGYATKPSSGYIPDAIKDSSSLPLNSMVKLDGMGNVTSTGNMYWMQFAPFSVADFTPLFAGIG